jgi:Helicase associated domain
VASSSTKWQTERWESGFAALSKFRAREGHCCPLQPRVEGKFKLGKWVSVQRYRKEFLLPERKRRHRVCVGLARRSLGTEFCGSFEIQTARRARLPEVIKRRSRTSKLSGDVYVFARQVRNRVGKASDVATRMREVLDQTNADWIAHVDEDDRDR